MKHRSENNFSVLDTILISCILAFPLACTPGENAGIKHLYKAGETVSLTPGHFDADSLELRLISKASPVLKPSSPLPCSYVVPDSLEGKAIGIYQGDDCLDFIRVYQENQLYTYDIKKITHNSLPIFMLTGGMSAEFAVQKSLENFTGGLSHTWKIGPGGGPEPVWSTADFLERSLEKTIGLYDKELGDTEVETVVIGTGTPLMTYLSAVTKAVFLPVHYLVSANSIAEIRSILKYSSAHVAPSYATLGYDASMSAGAVAWIKLLSIPQIYKDFIKRHRVKNVILAGIGEEAFGESFVRKVKGTGIDANEYADGSVYILYTEGGSPVDLKHIKDHITDYTEDMLEDGKLIADWESGLAQKQINGCTSSLSGSDVAVWLLTAPHDMGDFYNFAIDLSMQFMSVNQSLLLKKDWPKFVFNEYLIAHPLYEMMNGYVPVLYWQFVPVEKTVDKMFAYAYPAAEKYFGQRPVAPAVKLNGRLFVDDMEKELVSRGISSIVQRVKGVEEVWNLDDGFNAPCELIAGDILYKTGLSTYKEVLSSLDFLTLNEVEKLADETNGIDFIRID